MLSRRWTDILLSFTKDQTKKEAVISCMEKLIDTVQRRFMEHFIYAAYAFIESAENEDGFGKKNQKFTSAIVSPSSFCFSPLINLALHGSSEFPDDFVHCVVLVTVTCLLFYEDPAAFALLVRFHTKDKLENFKGSALEALHKYSTQIILLGGINQTDSELKSPQLSLSSMLTDVLENIIFQFNNAGLGCCHQALLCKLFTSTHPKVQQDAPITSTSLH